MEVFEWFQNNYLKANSTNSYVILTTDNMARVNIGGNIISNEETVKLLGITADNKLSFESLNKICKYVNEKLHALARISNHISQKKVRMIMRAFITSQSSYCYLVWRCYSVLIHLELIMTVNTKTINFIKAL